MKTRRLMAILLSLAMLLTFMPAMAFAEGDNSTDTQTVAGETQIDDEAQKNNSVEVKTYDLTTKELPAPHNLKWIGWGGTVSWDAVSGATGYHYKLQRAYPNDNNQWNTLKEGNTTETSVDVETKVKDDLNVIKAGSHNGKPVSYHVELYAYNGSGVHSDSRFVSSNISYVNVHTKDASKGTVTGSNYYVPGETVTVTAFPEANYEVSKYVLKSDMDYEQERDTTERSFRYILSSYNWDKWTDVEVVFSQEAEKANVLLDVGSKHVDLARRIYNILPNSMKGDTYSSGSRVSIKVPKTSASTVQQELNDAVYHALYYAEGATQSRMHNGEYFQIVGQNEINKYTTIDEVYSELYDDSKTVQNGELFHVLWATEKATYGSFTVKNNVCGKDVKVEEVDIEPDNYEPLHGVSGSEVLTPIGDITPISRMYKQTNTPEVVADSDSHYAVANNLSQMSYYRSPTLWLKSTDENIQDFYNSETWFSGKMIHGTKYAMGAVIEPKINYYVGEFGIADSDETDALTIKVNGADASKISGIGSYVMFTSEITADHDWDNGSVTKAPTVTEEGTMTYKCKNFSVCGASKTEVIPKLSVANNAFVAKAVARGKRAVKISWNKADGAERYVVYGARCGKKLKKIKTVKASKLSYTKKSLKAKKNYKFRVVAQKKVGGKWTTIAKANTAHVIVGGSNKKYTNPKSLKVKPAKMTLSVGKSKSVKTAIRKVKGGKALLKHAKKLRYTSSNPAVATVSAKGKVRAVGAGSCKIYVQAVNGVWKTVKVTVK